MFFNPGLLIGPDGKGNSGIGAGHLDHLIFPSQDTYLQGRNRNTFPRCVHLPAPNSRLIGRRRHRVLCNPCHQARKYHSIIPHPKDAINQVVDVIDIALQAFVYVARRFASIITGIREGFIYQIHFVATFWALLHLFNLTFTQAPMPQLLIRCDMSIAGNPAFFKAVLIFRILYFAIAHTTTY